MPEAVRIAVTADLHYDPAGRLTSPQQVSAEAGRIRQAAPDAVVIAGDLAHGLANFEACLAAFAGFEVPLGVVPGNHDLWRDGRGGHSTADLWERRLPEAIARAGVLNLERDVLRVGGVAVVGSLAWYDYSAIDPQYRAMPQRELVALKRVINADAHMMDWPRTDPDFAAEVGRAFEERLARAAADPAIEAIVVVTHVPLLEAQMLRKPGNRFWGVSNAFFGNLTLGEVVLAEPKVRAVVSGHTHVGRQATVRRDPMPPVAASVVPADYGAPAHVVVTL